MNAELAIAVDHRDYIGPTRPSQRRVDWPEITATAPTLTATMLRYLDQLSVSLRPASVTAAESTLRQFAGWLVAHRRDVTALADVERRHIEHYKIHLAGLPGARAGTTMSPTTIRNRLGTLRTFFERVSEWGFPDAPTRVLVFNGDLPTPDDPLPKFLSDPDAAKLMRAAGNADPERRLVVETLARTGLRVGELCALPADAVVFQNQRHWLRVPVGKLHNDRHVPLHPQLVDLIEQHRASRRDDIDRLIIFEGRPLDRRLAGAAASVHSAAGQLRLRRRGGPAAERLGAGRL